MLDNTSFYKDYTKKQFLFLVKESTMSSDNLLRFKRNLLLNDCQLENQNNR